MSVSEQTQPVFLVAAPSAPRVSPRRTRHLHAVDTSLPAAVTPPAVRPTNTFAILALALCILGAVPGVVLGHLARAQIRETGQRGWALATAGLAIGYFVLAAYGVWLVYRLSLATVGL